MATIHVSGLPGRSIFYENRKSKRVISLRSLLAACTPSRPGAYYIRPSVHRAPHIEYCTCDHKPSQRPTPTTDAQPAARRTRKDHRPKLARAAGFQRMGWSVADSNVKSPLRPHPSAPLPDLSTPRPLEPPTLSVLQRAASLTAPPAAPLEPRLPRRGRCRGGQCTCLEDCFPNALRLSTGRTEPRARAARARAPEPRRLSSAWLYAFRLRHRSDGRSN